MTVADSSRTRTQVAELLKNGTPDSLKNALELTAQWAKSEPTNPHLYLLQGEVRKRLGNKALAIQSFQMAAGLYAQNNKGVQYLASLKLILELDPENQDVRSQLAGLEGRNTK